MNKLLFFLIAFCFISFVGVSQIAIDTASFYFDSTRNFYFPKKKVHLNELSNSGSSIFKTNQNFNLIKGSEFILDGKKFTRFDQYFGVTKINGNSYFVSSFNDTILDIGGKVRATPLTFPSTIVSPMIAIQNLISSLNVYKFKWQDSGWENWIKEEYQDTTASFYPKTNLNIYRLTDTSFESPGNYYFAYPIYISAVQNAQDSTYFDSLYYVSAINGSILKRFGTQQASFSSNIHTPIKPKIISTASKTKSISTSALAKDVSNNSSASCNNPCEANGVTIDYYGGQTIYTAQFKYLAVCNNRLKENCNGITLYVRDNGFLTWGDFRTTNNSWPNPNDRIGTTALWCMERVTEVWRNKFNYSSYDNAGSQVDILMNNTGTLWINSPVANKTNGGYINVGLFQSTSSHQTVLDILGHEFGHATLDNTSGLGASPADYNNYASADEILLSEGFCDVLGQYVEYCTNQNYSTSTSSINDYVHGGNNPNGFQCDQTRSLINPKQICNPNTVGGANWYNATSIGGNANNFDTYTHRNATIIGYWYYLLAEGSSGTKSNDLGNQYCIKGIGQDNAAKIAFLTATNYIGNYNKSLSNARLAAIQAAVQLYGANSNEVAQTTAAWYAVGVGANYNGQIDVKNITVNTSNTSYNYNSKVSLQNVTINNGGVFYASSNTEVEVLPDFNANSGAFAELYIGGPICVGSARFGNPTSGRNNEANTESSINSNSINKNKEFLKENSFLIMPNPTSSSFKLQLDNSLEYPKQIVIQDILGRNIKTVDSPASFEYDFTLLNENEGVYVVVVYYNDKILTKRIIKN